MADRSVLQVDQAESEDKKLSGDVPNRGHDTDMGGADALPAHGVHQVLKRHQAAPYGNHEQAAGDAEERLRSHGVSETGPEGSGKATRLEPTATVDAFRGVCTMKILSGQQWSVTGQEQRVKCVKNL